MTEHVPTDRWRLLRSGACAPADNMAIDEALLLCDGPPTLRLYRWNPHGVSLGYFQNSSQFDLPRFAREGVPVVRRLTGGGAIFHGDEVTFSIAAPVAHPLFAGAVRESYDRVHHILAAALEACGAREVVPRGDAPLLSEVLQSPWCFHESTAFDLVAARRKLVGSAQRRTGGRVLHHGSLVLRANRYTPEVASLESLGGTADALRLEEALIESFGRALDAPLELGMLSPQEQSEAARLASEKYSSKEWTFRR
ncbi:MAG: lipoate--protein ligase family protein [Planctomycetes bacterium]|nr:lipoate--protein ligase family protein [Planctomycetota bacterium]